ncbi:MAG: HEAT repeat domain-containing protein [Gemmataceae bacterium]|nr:HEAT repeat domain-containing protein [Gemmataceae bacterium]
MPEPLIVTFYRKLPQPSPTDDRDLWQAGVQDAIREFRHSIKNNYTEGTLQRLVGHDDPLARQAAVLALGLVGTLDSNAAVAAALQDSDWLVRQFAEDALWEIWYRGDNAEYCWSLQQAMQLGDFAQTLAALDDLIREAPEFAEAYNQRAILLFRRGEFARSAADCKAVLRMNPYHFGAAAGMGQCYLKMNKPRAALRAFRQALELNPALVDLRDAVQALRQALGEEWGD